jgi:iron complex transport system substrate-binding protein
MRQLITICLACLLAGACSGNREPGGTGLKEHLAAVEKDPSTRYASRFTIRDMGDFRILRVIDPWQQSKANTFTYILGDNPDPVPDSLHGYPFIKIPVQRVITMSTTHVAMISQLGRSSTIRGVSGTELIYDQEVRRAVGANLVRDVGHDMSLNYETIVDIDPDVLFMYGVESSVRNTAARLQEMGIHVVFCAEYLERHPLGKAEWIRFFAQFYGLGEEARGFFGTIDSAYRELSGRAGEAGARPRILTGFPWKDTWYMAGGKSYASRLIADAGGEYLWQENPSAEAIPLDLESVYARALTADIWINPGNTRHLEELTAYDDRFGELPVVATGMVFNNDARLAGSGGGNDYWESGTVRPDLVLADLIRVFHPDLLPDHTLCYYRKLK